MKKLYIALSVVGLFLGTAFISSAAVSGQNPFSYIAKVFGSGGASLVNVDSQGTMLVSNGGPLFNNNLTTSTVLKTGAGRVFKVNVTTAGAAGAVYNSATIGGVAASNLISVVPATVGTITLDYPVSAGIVYVPGASQVSSISYQ